MVNDFNLQNLELTHDHVYDLLSISYGKKYKVKDCYKRINIGFAINFPGEFYYEYLWIHSINLKEVRLWWLVLTNLDDLTRFNTIKYEHFFKSQDGQTSRYYKTVFNSTNISQWAVNILIGLIENIFVEYSFVVPICHFLIFYPVHIHISIGTILGTIEWLHKKNKNGDDRGFLGCFYTLFFMQSVCVLKIGYYN